MVMQVKARRVIHAYVQLSIETSDLRSMNFISLIRVSIDAIRDRVTGYRSDLLSPVTDIQSLTIPPSSMRQRC